LASLPLLVVLTGPSGAGKDSVLERFRGRSAEGYEVAVNATTRARRDGEVEGVDYYFVSKERFAQMVRDGELLEHAVVYGQEKGVTAGPIKDLLARGQTVVLRTDIQGARYIKTLVPATLTIFIGAPSNEELEHRLRSRDTETPDELRVRLETARTEMAAAGEFDYTVVNDDLDRCVAEVESIIGQERARSGRPETVLP
jgi:guanylate kinase